MCMRNPYQPNINEVKLSYILHALSDPIRIQIVKFLAEEGEQHCSAFTQYTLKKSTLSHHYKVLRESGIIALRIQGRHYYYSVRETDLNNRFPTLLSLILTTPSSDI